MSLIFDVGDRNDFSQSRGPSTGGTFLENAGEFLGGIAEGFLSRNIGFPSIPGLQHNQPGLIERTFEGVFGGGNGNGQCAPLEIQRSATNPGGPPAASVWKRVEGCADTWARVPRGKRPVRDDCGNVVLKKARGRRRAAVTARDVRGARRVTKFVREFGVSSKVPAKKKKRSR